MLVLIPSGNYFRLLDFLLRNYVREFYNTLYITKNSDIV